MRDTSDEDFIYKDEVVRGGVKFLKIDKELNEATAQGQATLEQNRCASAFAPRDKSIYRTVIYLSKYIK